MAGHHDPKLLYSISGIRAFHIQHGEEQALTTKPETLSLLMVPTSSPFADLSTSIPQNEIPEEDFYLHLHLPPELDLPLPATTQIYHQPPRSYLIPRWDYGDDGAFTRIEFPAEFNQDDIDTFETILAQCTAFLERAPPPTGDATHKPYNPKQWAAGNEFGGGKTAPGQLVLVDEEDGSIVGELGEGAQIIEDPRLSHGTKNPVEIEISPNGQTVTVTPISEDYLDMARHPAYRSSNMVQNAAAASKLVVTGSSYLGKVMSNGAANFTQNTKPLEKPLNFQPGTHDRVRKLHNFTAATAGFSAKTLGQASKLGQNIGARLAGKPANRARKGYSVEGNVDTGYTPGVLNRSLIAFATIADGIAESGRHLLTTSGAAATTMVGHRYGAEAGGLAGQLAGGAKNVGLVYIDVTGVSRRAVIKSVAKGMVVGRVRGGGEVVVGGGDGGTVPVADLEKMGAAGRPAVNDSTELKQPQVIEQGFGMHSGTGPGSSGVSAAARPPPPAYGSGTHGGTGYDEDKTVYR